MKEEFEKYDEVIARAKKRVRWMTAICSAFLALTLAATAGYFPEVPVKPLWTGLVLTWFAVSIFCWAELRSIAAETAREAWNAGREAGHDDGFAVGGAIGRAEGLAEAEETAAIMGHDG